MREIGLANRDHCLFEKVVIRFVWERRTSVCLREIWSGLLLYDIVCVWRVSGPTDWPPIIDVGKFTRNTLVRWKLLFGTEKFNRTGPRALVSGTATTSSPVASPSPLSRPVAASSTAEGVRIDFVRRNYGRQLADRTRKNFGETVNNRVRDSGITVGNPTCVCGDFKGRPNIPHPTPMDIFSPPLPAIDVYFWPLLATGRLASRPVVGSSNFYWSPVE